MDAQPAFGMATLAVMENASPDRAHGDENWRGGGDASSLFSFPSENGAWRRRTSRLLQGEHYVRYVTRALPPYTPSIAEESHYLIIRMEKRRRRRCRRARAKTET